MSSRKLVAPMRNEAKRALNPFSDIGYWEKKIQEALNSPTLQKKESKVMKQLALHHAIDKELASKAKTSSK